VADVEMSELIFFILYDVYLCLFLCLCLCSFVIQPLGCNLFLKIDQTGRALFVSKLCFWSVVSVNHDVCLSSIQWRASSRGLGRQYSWRAQSAVARPMHAVTFGTESRHRSY